MYKSNFEKNIFIEQQNDLEKIIVTPGFLDVLRENNLTGESLNWENKKESHC